MSISPGELLAERDSAEDLFIDECDVEIDANYGTEISPGRRAPADWQAHATGLRCRLYEGRSSLAREAGSDREESTFELALPVDAGAIEPREYRIAEVRDATGLVRNSYPFAITGSELLGGFRHLTLEEIR